MKSSQKSLQIKMRALGRTLKEKQDVKMNALAWRRFNEAVSDLAEEFQVPTYNFGNPIRHRHSDNDDGWLEGWATDSDPSFENVQRAYEEREAG